MLSERGKIVCFAIENSCVCFHFVGPFYFLPDFPLWLCVVRGVIIPPLRRIVVNYLITASR
jgi:hypothetical protein